MSRLVLLVTALALTAAPALAAEEVKVAAKKPDPMERLLTTLTEAEVNLGAANPNEVPLGELLQALAKAHQVTFVFNEEAFKREGTPDIKEMKPAFSSTQLRGLTMHQFLNTALDGLGATYLVKNGVVEIVPTRHAAKTCKAALDETGDGDAGNRPRLKEPLVSAVIKEKPLNEAVAKLAEVYDLNVIVAPQSGDAKTGFVTARLLNVPADKAIELLAIQCDLRVVRKGNAFLITNKDQWNELFNEKQDRERQKIELEKFRDAPAAGLPVPMLGGPPPKPEPKP